MTNLMKGLVGPHTVLRFSELGETGEAGVERWVCVAEEMLCRMSPAARASMGASGCS